MKPTDRWLLPSHLGREWLQSVVGELLPHDAKMLFVLHNRQMAASTFANLNEGIDRYDPQQAPYWYVPPHSSSRPTLRGADPTQPPFQF